MPKRIGRRPRLTPERKRPQTSGTTAAPTSLTASLASPADLAQLVPLVPQLAPQTLHQLIRHCGLDVCAELVAAATPQQLASVFDLDLWRSARPGTDERFDAERFGEWVELLIDAGGSVAARTVAAMDEHLVVAGLSRYIRVFDPAAIAAPFEDELPDVELTADAGPECIVGGYLLRGRTADAWDAIVSLLLALAADHPDRFHAVMRQCRRLSNSTPEVDGLDDLLMAPEQLLHDAAVAREDRRSQQGYTTPADARAFLLMARRPRRASKGEPSDNPLVTAYFRATNEIGARDDNAAPGTPPPAATLPGVAETPGLVVDTLVRAGLLPAQPRALLEGTASQSTPFPLVRRLIDYVHESDDALYVARSQELAFLTNTLVAGCSIQSRAFTPQEAADAAVGICNLGLEHWPARWRGPRVNAADLDVTLPDAFLIDHGLVSAFEVGWAVLYEDVSVFVAARLVLALAEVRCSDPDIQKGLNALRIELSKQRKAGTPWRVRSALEVIAMLDMPAWVSVRGLLDECPVIPAALTATLERRTGAISATAFEFISTRSQLATVRAFMAQFVDILGR